jgi:GAF domain-containing protein
MNAVRRILQTVFAPPASQRWRAHGLYALLVLYGLSRLVYLLPEVTEQTAGQLNLGTATVTAVSLLLLVLAEGAYWLIRRGSLRRAALIMAAALLVEGTAYLLVDGWGALRGWSALWLGIALGALMLAWWQSGVCTAFALAVITISSFQDYASLTAAAQTERAATYGVLAMGTLALAGIASVVPRAGQREHDSARSEDSARHLIAVVNTAAQATFSRTDLDETLKQLTEIVRSQFDTIYHVQIFLIRPETEVAVLHASTGTVGEQLLAQEYSVDVGGLSVVGRATLSGAMVLVPNITRDDIHKPLALLPDTHTELAIPLKVREDIIGALDIHSRQITPFTDDDITVFKAIAQQIALAFDGLRLYEMSQQNLRENQALYQQTQANLREIERLNYQLTGRAWTEYLRLQSASTALTLDLESDEVTPDAEWTDTLNKAAVQRQVVSTTHDGRRLVALPIIVRNEIVGAMEFELEAEGELPGGALELINAVGQRLGLALENRRLFDETQRVAQREALINDIGADLQGASGVDAIIQRAAHHLQESLSARQVTIRLGTTKDDDKGQETS